jgi:dimeric dUTPase (all-alpha-NTP-PPase superfamily)
MDFSEMFMQQQAFDDFLIKRHGLEGKDLLPDIFVALDVKLSELANEVKFFKYWDEQPMNRKLALEEYGGGLCFFLSIGNQFMVPRTHEYVVKKETVHQQYLELKKWVLMTKGAVEWHYTFGLFSGLGEMLGFSHEEIAKMFKKKHKVNYKPIFSS